MVAKNPTVFVVDDDAAIRESLGFLMRSCGHEVETFDSGQAFLDRFSDDRPGCLILDVRMPGITGLELQRMLREKGWGIPIIIITGHGDVPIAVRALKQGAMEFLEKPFSRQLLLERVQAAVERDAQQRERAAVKAANAHRLSRLTRRELEVLDLVVAGKASKEIAVCLGISKKTVDVHRSRILGKLKVESLPELVGMVLNVREGHAVVSAN